MLNKYQNKINIQANNNSFTVKKFSKVYKYYFLFPFSIDDKEFSVHVSGIEQNR